MGDNSPVHIDSNTNMNIEANSSSDKDMTSDNFLEETSGINIED